MIYDEVLLIENWIRYLELSRIFRNDNLFFPCEKLILTVYFY